MDCRGLGQSAELSGGQQPEPDRDPAVTDMEDEQNRFAQGAVALPARQARGEKNAGDSRVATPPSS